MIVDVGESGEKGKMVGGMGGDRMGRMVVRIGGVFGGGLVEGGRGK